MLSESRGIDKNVELVVDDNNYNENSAMQVMLTNCGSLFPQIQILHMITHDPIAVHYLPYRNTAHVINRRAPNIPFRSDPLVCRRGGDVASYAKSLLIPACAGLIEYQFYYMTSHLVATHLIL